MKSDQASRRFIEFQTRVLALWQGLFNNQNLDLNEHFGELGGHSELADLLYQQVCVLMGDSFKISPTIAYDYPSVAAMAAYLWDLKFPKKKKRLNLLKKPIITTKPLPLLASVVAIQDMPII